MLESNPAARIVLTTAENRDDAATLGRALVEERLVACATLVPGVESIFHWEGKVETASETLLLLKTEAGKLHALEIRLHELHKYETPEFLVLSVDAGSRKYLEWMTACLRQS